MPGVPNGLLFKTTMAGNVCKATGNPEAGATITVLDRYGRVASEMPEHTNDIGFFIMDLLWWGQRADSLSVTTVSCGGSKELRLDRSSEQFVGCAKASQGTNGSSFIRRVWRITCNTQEK